MAGDAGVSSGAFASASCRPEFPEAALKKVGLLHGHAYTILHAVQTKSGLRLLELKNPWGSFEWCGDYSDQSSKWTSVLRKEVDRLVKAEDKKMASSYSSKYKLENTGAGVEVKDDGAFWMSSDDFFKYFSDVGICDPWIFGSTCYTVRQNTMNSFSYACF